MMSVGTGCRKPGGSDDAARQGGPNGRTSQGLERQGICRGAGFGREGVRSGEARGALGGSARHRLRRGETTRAADLASTGLHQAPEREPTNGGGATLERSPSTG